MSARAGPEEHTLRGILRTVRHMRAAQARYFRAAPGSPEKRHALGVARGLEARVDRLLAAALGPGDDDDDDDEQPRLF